MNNLHEYLKEIFSQVLKFRGKSRVPLDIAETRGLNGILKSFHGFFKFCSLMIRRCRRCSLDEIIQKWQGLQVYRNLD